jgi:hypothetical protein
MVKRLNVKSKNHIASVLDFLKYSYCPDFYFTKDNQRIFIETEKQLKELIRECKEVWFLEENDETIGIIAIWISKGGEVQREYIKMSAKNYEAADALLSVLLWNYNNESCMKIDKNSIFLKLFNRKGFRFLSGRGRETLLKRDKFKPKFYKSKKD